MHSDPWQGRCDARHAAAYMRAACTSGTNTGVPDPDLDPRMTNLPDKSKIRVKMVRVPAGKRVDLGKMSKNRLLPCLDSLQRPTWTHDNGEGSTRGEGSAHT